MHVRTVWVKISKSGNYTVKIGESELKLNLIKNLKANFPFICIYNFFGGDLLQLCFQSL